MNTAFYILTFALLTASYLKDKNKTKKALKKAWKAFENILPEFLVVILFVGFIIAAMDPEMISKIIVADSGVMGVILSSVVGAITLIPGFVAFPMAALLLEGGAGYMQIGAFVSSLMMVGVVTIPVEVKYFGKKITIARNVMAFLFSFVVAIVMGVVLS
ncbi:MAG: permease [Bacillota bacterium]|nr:permease [Bacillota bacterium]